MKSTLLIAALFLGFSTTGFSQTIDGSTETRALLVDKSTGQQVEMIIENPNVTVVPGEIITILNNGTDRKIAVKGNTGEFVGYLNTLDGKGTDVNVEEMELAIERLEKG